MDSLFATVEQFQLTKGIPQPGSMLNRKAEY